MPYIRTESDRADIQYRGAGEAIGLEQEQKHWAASSSGANEPNKITVFVRSNPEEDYSMSVSKVASERFLVIGIISKI